MTMSQDNLQRVIESTTMLQMGYLYHSKYLTKMSLFLQFSPALLKTMTIIATTFEWH